MASLFGMSFPVAYQHRFRACQAGILRLQKAPGLKATILLSRRFHGAREIAESIMRLDKSALELLCSAHILSQLCGQMLFVKSVMIQNRGQILASSVHTAAIFGLRK